MDLPTEIKRLEEQVKTLSSEKSELTSKLMSIDMAISEAMGCLKAFEAVRQQGVAGNTIISGFD